MADSKRKRSGSLISTYRDRSLTWRDFFFIFIPSSAAALTPLLVGLDKKRYAMENFGPAAAQSWARPWYLLATAALIPLIWLALIRVRQSHRLVKIYAKGLFIQSTGGKKHFIFWEKISGVTQLFLGKKFLGFSYSKKHKLAINLDDGSIIKLDSGLNRIDEIGNRIKAKVYPRILRECRTSIRNGKGLDFGPVLFNQQEITLKNETFSWEMISSLSVKDGFVHIKLDNQRTIKIPIDQMPNIEIFIQLFQEGINP